MAVLGTSEVESLRLENVLGAISVNEFERGVSDRGYLLCPGALSKESAERVFSLDQFDDIVVAQSLAYPQIELIENGNVGPPPTRNGGTRISPIDIRDKIANGASIRLRNVNRYCATVSAACSLFSDQLGDSLQANAYFTPRSCQGFNPHYDDHDVWILQCWGTKIWRLYSDYDHRTELPSPGEVFDGNVHKPGEAFDEVLLKPGDMLFITRGVMHAAECRSQSSLHLTFGAESVAYADLILECVRQRRKSDIGLRRRVPKCFFADHDSLGEMKAKLLADWGYDVAEQDLAAARSALIERFVARVPMAMNGLIATVLAEEEDGAGQAYAYRSTAIWRSAPDEKGIKLILPDTIAILNPDEFAVLETVRAAGVVDVGQIQTALSQQELAELLARFVEIGLLVRCPSPAA